MATTGSFLIDKIKNLEKFLTAHPAMQQDNTLISKMSPFFKLAGTEALQFIEENFLPNKLVIAQFIETLLKDNGLSILHFKKEDLELFGKYISCFISIFEEATKIAKENGIF